MAALQESNTNWKSVEENQKRLLFTRIQFNGEINNFIITCACMEKERFDELIKTLAWNDSREITNSRSKKLNLSEDEIISIKYGGALKAGKAIRTSTINLKDSFENSSLFDIPEDANHCIIHYVWDEGREDHVVRFSLKEEFERMNDNADQLEVTSQERKLKLSLISISKRGAFLKDLQLKSSQVPVSGVYRSEEEAETEVVISVDLLPKMLSDDTIYSFSFFILRDQKQVNVPVSIDTSYKFVRGPVLPRDVFCAVAEFTAEKTTLGKNGVTFISKKDNRIQVQVPAGALEDDEDITFKVENVDPERHRQYVELFPKIFEPLVGFPTSLSIECDLEKRLREKAKVYLPVIKDGDGGEVLFIHWEDEKATPLTHLEDKSSPESPYFVEVDHFSSFTAQTISSHATLEEVIYCTRLLLGRCSIATVLTYIIPDTMPGIPRLLIDFVELNRVKTAMKELKEEGLKEIPGRSRSSDCLIDEGGYVNIEIEGNIRLDTAMRKKVMRVHFFRHRTSNRIIVPVKSRNNNQRLSTIVYSTKTKDWIFRVEFSIAAFLTKGSENPKPRGGRQEAKVPEVLSDRSLSTLGENLPDSTCHRLGIELGMNDDKITVLMESKQKASGIGFRVLKQWMLNNARRPHIELVDSLVQALEEIERGDVAEIVSKCRDEDRPIRRKDFCSGSENKGVTKRKPKRPPHLQDAWKS